MKPNLLTPFLVLALLLSACGAATETPAAEIALEEIYTSVAMTLSSQEAAAAATPTLQPTFTLTHQLTATLISTLPPVQNSTAPVVAANTNNACDNAVYVSDVTIPDGTVLVPGQSFTKTWRFQNTGTCAWSTSYSIIYVSGDAMSGAATALSAATSSGSTLDVSIAIVAPGTTGTYTGYWKLQNASGATFGESVFVKIVVSDNEATVTSTPTATEDSSAYTSTPTATSPAPTATPEPSETSESAP